MSIVTINIGQCGTQIGHDLFSILYENATTCSQGQNQELKSCKKYKDSVLKTFFNETSMSSQEARCVSVDMELKAITKALKNQSKQEWKYAKGQQFFQKSGSGNNWSYGFNQLGKRFENDILDIIRKEVEKCDSFAGFQFLMSIAGGTGSGVGSFLLNSVRDNYSKSNIINPFVLPYEQGEVAVQYYNALLSLASMSYSCDLNIIMHNNYLHDVCKRDLGISQVSFSDMNSVAAYELASVLLPVDSNRKSSRLFSSNRLNDIVIAATNSTQLKMAEMCSIPHIAKASIPFTTFSWHYLAGGLNKLVTSRSRSSIQYVSNIVTLRGSEANLYDIAPHIGKKLNFRSYLNAKGSLPLIWRCTKPLNTYEKSISLLSNSSACIKPLSVVVDKAWPLFCSRSYIHQYKKYGLDEDDFETAFSTVQGVMSSYKSL